MNMSRLKKMATAVLLSAGLFASHGSLALSSIAPIANCKYVVNNSWGSGATASIEITNIRSTVINGWSVNWNYVNNRVTGSWNAAVTGSNPYTATNLSWNASIQPGQTISIGVQVNGNGSIEAPIVYGSICTNSYSTSSVTTSRSSSSSTAPSSRSSSSSLIPSSVSSSSSTSACTGVQQCNWYGTLYPLCVNTQSGWGYENNKSCISRATCTSQPSPFGVTGGACVPSSSSISSLSSSSIRSSISSSRSSSSSSLSCPQGNSWPDCPYTTWSDAYCAQVGPSLCPRSSSSTSSRSSSSVSSGGITSVELTKRMGIGWNVGNSLDAIGGETNWGNPLITQQLINSVKAAGFKTIRLPVAWSKFSDESNFVIQSAWMDRVEQVVNYALNADMYVVMNIHWDNGWMQPTYAQQAYVNNRLKIMWTQIATRFSNYDDRLLFAGTNEVMVDGDYGTPTAEYYTVQNSFNQTFVTAVRATGGKNATRHLVVQGFNTNIDHTVNFAKIPTDIVSNRLMMEVHYYDPYNFTLNTSSNITQWGSIATNPSATETWANESYTDAQFQKMKVNFVDKGIGVILGEYGVVSRTNVADHETYRNYWNEYITKSAYTRGLVPVYWDNGFGGNGGMALFDRASGAQLYPNLIQAIVKADD
ncbi:cellulase family glycosylhydrolase [Cellvibrio fibrivorans]|uniref:Endoglucanase n=1 Tax=Cellvibrio fibrivorans TaxID=126350 RepID=A0ABU1UV15_9GAMM|nr:cellulase family glycosylhydrolase [Cellvibrio fibrivorans]MDR7089005.1 endoglucanase [Cellvibrio fibrivorans]